jgi:F0F1-type ATP synthase membrane subunit b/b'
MLDNNQQTRIAELEAKLHASDKEASKLRALLKTTNDLLANARAEAESHRELAEALEAEYLRVSVCR